LILSSSKLNLDGTIVDMFPEIVWPHFTCFVFTRLASFGNLADSHKPSS
jgi:hypothetical protein